MPHHAHLPSSGGPRGPRRNTVRFHLIHEHGYWVLDAREENTTQVHSKSLSPFSSCSVLHSTCFGGDQDIGVKIRRPLELLRGDTHSDVLLLNVVVAAQCRDLTRASWPGGAHVEEHVLKIERAYVRIFEWLLYHPGLVVPHTVFARAAH